MKVYRITPQSGTWWAEIATANMKTQDDQTIVQVRSYYNGTLNPTDIAAEIVALGVYNKVGKRFTEIELKALCTAENFNLVMLYENEAAATKYTALTPQATPTFDPVSGSEVAWGDTITIASASADNIYYTVDGTIPSDESTDQAVTPAEVDENEMTVRAIAYQDGLYKSAIATAIYTQRYADAPTAALAVGSANPVGGVTDVALPDEGATDETGAVTGWATGTADTIKFTVTDGDGTSVITINGDAYTSGEDYTIAAAEDLTIVVTTTETGTKTAVRTFTVSVAAA